MPRLSESLRGHLYAFLQSLRGRPLARCIRTIERQEHLAPVEFDRQQRERIAEVLALAKTQVSRYRNGPWKNASLSPDRLLDGWPVLEKADLLNHFDDLLAETRPARIETLKSSGTTGMPAAVASDYLATTFAWAHRYRALQWHGIPVGARSLRLTHDRRPFRDFVLGQRCVWPVDSRRAIDDALAYARGARPMLVAGTPSALFYLARRMREHGITEPLAPFARVGGEQLFPFQRKHIESYLGARAIDSYGATETGALAGECPAGSMHVHGGLVHLEVFNGDTPAEPGELGDIVVTTLRNRAMPLIRYRVGDRGRLSLERCVCGLPQPVLLDLQARAGDLFEAADGSSRHSSVLISQLNTLFDDAEADRVRQIQFRQNNTASWDAWVEGSEGLTKMDRGSEEARAIERIVTGIVRATFGPQCAVAVHFVHRLPREHGKLRYYRTERRARVRRPATPSANVSPG